MKTKKLSKKLELNKKTVADLNNKKMNFVKGGLKWECDTESPPTESCQTEPYYCTEITYCAGTCGGCDETEYSCITCP